MLALAEQHLEPGHSLIADALNDLAVLYREQGNYEEAELLFQRVLRIFEQLLGPNHTLVGKTLSNLETISYERGRDGSEP